MDDMADLALSHIEKLLWNYSAPVLDGDLAKIPRLKEIHDELEKIRHILSIFSTDQDENLLVLIERLRRQIDTQNSAMKALQKSESRYKDLASHDYLTGAMSRRFFTERAVAELDNSVRLKIPCGIIMIDLDFFKNFNDKYGHLAGDEALRHIVKVISSFSRKHDFLGRYGGEEFVFFFTITETNKALVLAERIRESIEKSPVKLELGPVPITASFGVAMANIAEYKQGQNMKTHVETIIKNADTAMYMAKNAGRNQVMLYSDES
ncbi:MAG: GGDEF domain-containing protein [Treponema sp.]|nr:GGDEF domain-containing protein [Treponema sp.]